MLATLPKDKVALPSKKDSKFSILNSWFKSFRHAEEGVKQAKLQYNNMGHALVEYMKSNGIETYETVGVQIRLVESATIDWGKLKRTIEEKHPDILDECTKTETKVDWGYVNQDDTQKCRTLLEL